MGTIYKLIIEDDEGKTTVYPLSQGEISIGRKDGNTIRLMERNVSRRHARLVRANGSVLIEDLDSYNGIRINGERINGRYEVKEGDLVEIGDYHLALQASEVEDEAPQKQAAAPHGAPHGGFEPSESGRDQWPLAGTVPDFRLPDEILADVRQQMQKASAGAKGAPRDTLVDQPASALAPTPLVGPPGRSAQVPPTADLQPPPPHGQLQPRPDDPSRQPLPPFPGGLQPPPLSAPASPQRLGSVTELESRPPALKPQPQPHLHTSGPGPGQAKKEAEALTTPINVGPARLSSVPRLVCVSTSYAGKEFALTRPELIIGRVEDNDIVIEHRSVSRNHAKIVFDGRVHKIIDLQSANGILVNGEEYAMTDLRKGDLIELGHVRFRFVPATEPFIPTDEEVREMKEAGVTMPAPTDGLALLGRGIEVTQPHVGPSPTLPPAPTPKLAAPSRPPSGPEMPGFDPSMAATVTDTPLSALSFGPTLTPQIEAPSSDRVAERMASERTDRAPVPTPRKGETPARRPGQPDQGGVELHERDKERPRNDTIASPRRVDGDQRPTEVNVAARSNTIPAASARSATEPAGPRRDLLSGDLDLPRAADRSDSHGDLGGQTATRPSLRAKIGILVGLAVGVVGLICAAVILLSGPDGQADKALREMYRAGNFKGAVEHCKTNQGNFKDPTTALRLCLDAKDQLQAQPKALEPGKTEPGKTDQPKTEEQKPSGALAPGEQPAGEGDEGKKAEAKAEAAPEGTPSEEEPAAAEGTPTDVKGRSAAKRALTRADPKGERAEKSEKADKGSTKGDKKARAQDLYSRAWQRWSNGEASKAIDLLLECVALTGAPASNLAKCHRTLGSVYAQVGDTAKSLEHYKKYLALEPGAQDVSRVKEIIREAETQL